ncbi:UNVERIFIED_CONTAM: hypothetical protein Sangu_3227000 [Sesamum angustifolium]|uniref:DUF4218 domain-containing protein n=1 Tax=Sesamum angustifolium TaxID=2727405 RepID=A0AAW2JHB7_9LAMI
MYSFERFLRELKKKVKNKVHVEASIVKANIVKEIGMFTSQYFELDVQSKQSMPRTNDERTSSNDRIQVDPKLNYTDKELLKYIPCYFLNGYNFQTERHNTGKSTMKCGICVKSSSYTDEENDFYGIIEEIVQLTYPLIPKLHIVLFKCRWVDPIRGMKVHPRYHLIDVNFKKLYRKMIHLYLHNKQYKYILEYPSMKRDKADWMAICKIKAQRVVDESKWIETLAYQSEEVVPVPVVATDNQSYNLREPNGLQVVVDLSMAQQ